ncbi:MAG: MFS transporter [Coriobacteriales bacterium]|jgi:EmrB/QacA subfamily drug resistance transporter|nr:MFS transporter [Coriobacteriales bacterium]
MPTSPAKRRAILFLICASSFMNSFMTNSVNLAIPAMSAEFSMTATDAGWVVSAFLLAMAALCVPFGRISDLTNRRVVYLAGLAAFAVTSLATVFAWSAAVLLACRVLSGVSAALVFSSNTPILLAAYPREQMGRALGYMVTGVYLGLASGPVFGGLLTGALGWTSIFILCAVCEAAFFLLALVVVPRHNQEQAPGPDASANVHGLGRFDPLGSLLLVVGIALLMIAFSTFTQAWYCKLLLVVALLILVAFVLVELHSQSPVLKIDLFLHNKNYACSNFATLLNYGATFGLTYLMSNYLQVVQGFPTSLAGLILIAQPICMALVSPFVGHLTERRSPYLLATAGMVICALSILLFCFIGETTPLWLLIVGLVLMGFGVGVFASPNNAAVLSNVAPADNGVASSTLNSMRAVGQSASLAIITLVSSLALGQESFASASPAQLVGATRISFIIFGALSVCTIILSMQRRSTPATPTGTPPGGGKGAK